MKIKSLSIGGFKNLKQNRIEVDRITALISPNNYGKSNVLLGLNFALRFLSAGEKDRKKLSTWKKGIPLNPYSAGDPFSFEIEFHEPSLGQYQYVRYGFSFAWLRDDAAEQRITDEWLEMRENESVKYTRYLKRNEGQYRKAKSTNAFRNITLGSFQLAIDTLSSIDDIEYIAVLDYIKHLNFKNCSSLDINIQDQGFSFEMDESNASFSETAGIPQLLYTLEATIPERFNLFKEAISTLLPEVTDIEIGKASFGIPHISDFDSHDTYRIFVKIRHMNQPMDITMLSAGAKRIFWILTTLFTNNSETQLFGIEELETCIHPRLLKQTLELLNDNLGNSSLLITSHSPYLVQYLNLENIYIGVPDETGLASFLSIMKSKSKSLVTTAQNRGLSVGEYLFDLMSGDTKSNFILSKCTRG